MNSLASLMVLLLCSTCVLASIPSAEMITGAYLESCSQQGTVQWSAVLQITPTNMTATYTIYPYACSSSPGLVLTYSGSYSLGPLNQGQGGATQTTVVVQSIVANSTGFASPAILASLCPDAPALTTTIGATVDLTAIVCGNFSLAPFNCAAQQKKFACLLDMSADMTQLLVGNGTCDSSASLSPPDAVFSRTSNLPPQYIEYSTDQANYAHTNFVPQSASNLATSPTFMTNISTCHGNNNARMLISNGYLLEICDGRLLATDISSGAAMASTFLSSYYSILLSALGNLVFVNDVEYLFCVRIDSDSMPLLWTVPVGSSTQSNVAPVILNQLVYIYGGGILASAFNVTNGKLVSRANRTINYISVYNQQLYSSEGAYFCMITPVTFQKQWCVLLTGTANTYPALASGMAVVSVLSTLNVYPYTQTILYGISLSSQKFTWQVTFPYGVGQLISIANNVVYTSSTSSYYNLTSGALAGIFTPSPIYTIYAITTTNDQVFLWDGDSQLHAFRQSTGILTYSMTSVQSFVIGEGKIITVDSYGVAQVYQA